MDYIHQELGQEIQSISGTYTPLKELTIKHSGKDVLCVIGNSVVDTACCGSGSFLYATVPGYVLKLIQYRQQKQLMELDYSLDG